MRIDDNPLDTEDYWYEDADEAIQAINKELGFGESLYNEMCTTISSDGKQTKTEGKITVSWKYHPNRGLEVSYTVNK